MDLTKYQKEQVKLKKEIASLEQKKASIVEDTAKEQQSWLDTIEARDQKSKDKLKEVESKQGELNEVIRAFNLEKKEQKVLDNRRNEKLVKDEAVVIKDKEDLENWSASLKEKDALVKSCEDLANQLIEKYEALIASLSKREKQIVVDLKKIADDKEQKVNYEKHLIRKDTEIKNRLQAERQVVADNKKILDDIKVEHAKLCIVRNNIAKAIQKKQDAIDAFAQKEQGIKATEERQKKKEDELKVMQNDLTRWNQKLQARDDLHKVAN